METKFKEGQRVVFKTEDLFNTLRAGNEDKVNTMCGYIRHVELDNGNDYFDYFEAGDMMACDGECCTVYQVGENVITLRNDDGYSEHYITLSYKEADIALTLCR